MLRIKTHSIGILLSLILLTVGMGFVGWMATKETTTTINKFESEVLPEISIALSLSEEVAQLAALSPYIANAAKPFLLQRERKRIEKKHAALKVVVSKIQDESFRKQLENRLDKLFIIVDQLFKIVESELFIREDILALQFEIEDLILNNSNNNDNLKILLNTLEKLKNRRNQPIQITHAKPNIEELELTSHTTTKSESPKKIRNITTTIINAHDKLIYFDKQKPYLIATIRAKSEELTNQATFFVSTLKSNVSDQRIRINKSANQGRYWILIMFWLTLLVLTYNAWFTYRMTHDLEAVTKDMTKLADGDTNTPEPTINRSDEIGDLAESFGVFRRDAILVKEVSQNLKEQSKLLETVFNEIRDGLSVFSEEQRLVAWNKSYLDIFNFSQEKIYENMDLIELQKLMSNEKHRNLSLDGHDINIKNVNLARLKSAQTFERHYDNGKVIEFRSQPMPQGGFVTLYRDLTDRLEMEKQLIHSQKMEVLGQLTGGVSHDFNNLLAAVLGNLQLLEQSPGLSSEQKKYVHRSLRAAEKGVNLVKRLLAFSRKQKLNPEKVDVDDIIISMIDLIEYSVGKKIKIKIDLQSKSKVFVDLSQLENAILNLVLNSSAAMPKGGEILLKTKKVFDKELSCHSLNLSIQDTGNGIPKEIQERIFDPFFTTKPVGKGSGLGLSIVYGFVTQSGGKLKVNSIINKGTEIVITFPIHTKKETLIASKSDFLLNLNLSPNAKIALVEDDFDVKITLAKQLESIGFSVTDYSSAEHFLNTLITHKTYTPDLVISDINLQGEMNGVDLLNKLSISYPKVNVILISGMPREILEEYCGLPSDLAILQKPVSIDKLKQLLL